MDVEVSYLLFKFNSTRTLSLSPVDKVYHTVPKEYGTLYDYITRER